MPDPRRIVPDTSVLVAAMLQQGEQTARAQNALNAIWNGTITCYAPDVLLVEFMKIAVQFRHGSRRGGVGLDAGRQLETFLRLPINYIPSMDLVSTAFNDCDRHEIPAPDSWFLAAAELKEAELWIARETKDRFASSAASVYDKVYTLQRHEFGHAPKKRRGTK